MKFNTSTLFSSWKTTSIGLLMLLITIQHSIHFDLAGHLAMTQKDWFTVLLGLAGAVIGASQNDAK